MNKLSFTNIIHLSGAFRSRRLAGVDYQIYPCIMLVEGVHHGIGSDPVYYPPQVLESSVPMWNNMPVTVGHPVNQQGEHVLCNHDGTIRTQWEVGKIMNARYEDGKLKADLWINTQLAQAKSPSLLQFVQNGGQLEVSTGLMAADDGTQGVWNTEEFSATIQEIIPDHLALLPNSTGACSWDDGCGVRWNQKEKEVLPIFYTNSLELSKMMDKVRQYVESMDEWDKTKEQYRKINYTRAIFDDYFVYTQDIRTGGNQPQTSGLYKQSYSLSTDGEIVLSGEPVEVVEEVKYRIKSVPTTNQSTKKENEEMKDKPCCEKKVGELIANADNGFTEEDREWLTSMNEAQLEKLVDNAAVKKAPAKEEEEEDEMTPKKKTNSLNEFLQDAPPEIRSVLNAGLRELDNKRIGLITAIKSNERNKFTDEQFKEMDIAVLESIASLLPPAQPSTPDYSGLNPARTVANNAVTEEPYVPVSLSDNLGKK